MTQASETQKKPTGHDERIYVHPAPPWRTHLLEAIVYYTAVELQQYAQHVGNTEMSTSKFINTYIHEGHMIHVTNIW